MFSYVQFPWHYTPSFVTCTTNSMALLFLTVSSFYCHSYWLFIRHANKYILIFASASRLLCSSSDGGELAQWRCHKTFHCFFMLTLAEKNVPACVMNAQWLNILVLAIYRCFFIIFMTIVNVFLAYGRSISPRLFLSLEHR